MARVLHVLYMYFKQPIQLIHKKYIKNIFLKFLNLWIIGEVTSNNLGYREFSNQIWKLNLF